MLDINYKGFAERYITLNNIKQFHVGDIIETGVHWTNGGEYDGSEMFSGNYTYCFECREVYGHEVDYDEISENEDYADELYTKYGITEECYDEKEIVVENDKFKIIEINSISDEITEEDFMEDDYRMPLTVRVVQIR